MNSTVDNTASPNTDLSVVTLGTTTVGGRTVNPITSRVPPCRAGHCIKRSRQRSDLLVARSTKLKSRRQRQCPSESMNAPRLAHKNGCVDSEKRTVFLGAEHAAFPRLPQNRRKQATQFWISNLCPKLCPVAVCFRL